jgi:hypothetical protein
MSARISLRIGLFLVLATVTVAVMAPEGFALITGGEGNKPVGDPGWPKGAAAIFNVPSRIAWWEGPPLGGGQWHAECRGDAKALSAVLADFAKLDVKAKRVVVHDGVGNSFWLNPNQDPTKRNAAKMDWSFMVWQPDSWQRLRKLPADLNPTNGEDAKGGPPAQVDVYTGGNVKWADVTVPKGLEVVDQRLEAHGFTIEDGIVLEGKITDLATKKPVRGQVRLEQVEPQKGGYGYTTAAKAQADVDGHWVLKNAPAAWQRVVIEAEGYIPRVLGYLKPDGQPGWHQYDGGLARPAVVAGRVMDADGKPLADVEVRFADVTAGTGGRYDAPLGTSVKTDADGRFRNDQLPVGKATIWVHKPGYTRPGLGQAITTPKEDVELTMNQAGRIVVTVDFTATQRPKAYLVSLSPIGGDAIGSYGGSGQINDKNQMTFDNVPPGKYVVRGQPNPTTELQKSDPVAVDVFGGKTAEVKLTAR